MKKNQSSCQAQPGAGGRSGQPSAAYREPEMRRWPHPVPTTPQTDDASLHYIACALSYQNQLLADIKALLQAMALPAEEGEAASGD